MGLVIYTKTDCYKCKNAKQAMNNLQLDFTELNIGENSVAKSFILERGHKTVPQIYFDGKYLGNSEITTEVLLSTMGALA